ncbi:MAG: hypothetical protein E7675_02600 [Ruminococcaceae bacterium]|nr:hypothetical protein [Oscillospiraceae bacterium]
MKLFDFLKKKDRKTLDVKEYKNTNETEKKKLRHTITIDPRDATPPEEYYENQSIVFGKAKIIVAGLLIGMIVLAFTVLSDLFTKENFKYLVKYINFNTVGSIEEFRDVVYPDLENCVFGDFRQDFVIASPGVLKLYNCNGGISISSTPSTKNPGLSISGEGILLYDIGDCDFYVYNNFSKLFSATMSEPIIMGDMSESGKFAIVTESSGHAARIDVFNEKFISVRGINKNAPVVSIKLSQDGRYLAVATVDILAADYTSTLTVYDLEKENRAVLTVEITNELPAAMEFEIEEEDDFGLCVVTNLGTRRYTKNGESERVTFEGKEPLHFDISEELTAYTVKNSTMDNSSTLYCYSNSDMRQFFAKDFEEKILDVKICKDSIYVLTGTRLIKMDSDGTEEVIELQEKPYGMVVFSSGEVFIRYSSIFKLAKFE